MVPLIILRGKIRSVLEQINKISVFKQYQVEKLTVPNIGSAQLVSTFEGSHNTVHVFAICQRKPVSVIGLAPKVSGAL